MFIFELDIFECLLGEDKTRQRTRVTILVFKIIFPLHPQYIGAIYHGFVQKIYLEGVDQYLRLELFIAWA